MEIQLDELCDELERRLRAGEVAGIDDLVDRLPTDKRSDAIRELLPIELYHRQASGDEVDRRTYLDQFSSYPEAVNAALDSVIGSTGCADATSAEFVATSPLAIPESAVSTTPIPERIGRHVVREVLGEGGFGRVYLAHDEQLERPVAIKVPHPHLIVLPGEVALYRAEAQMVAGLDHRHIVPVYDVGQSDEFPFYIVSKYVAGSTLASRIQEAAIDFTDAADLVATIAEALHHAHKQGLVHRDVKPGNILIDKDGQPHIVDFGLALRETEVGKGPRYAGTPAYMSPEQARGEGHRVDGRSDVYGLGAVLFELVIGRRAVSAQTREEVYDQVVNQDVRPLRQINDRVPEELERICLKSLSKRLADRYTTALDMARDLQHFIQTTRTASNSAGAWATDVQSADVRGTDARAAIDQECDGGEQRIGGSQRDSDGAARGSSQAFVPIVPKGLRSFDEHDADFFLELLPGPRDRDGLPESVRFWKTAIEQTDSDKTFPVGLMYGPSGCGKSSFVKAGLLPQLSPNVLCVFLEATGTDTEERTLRQLRRVCPGVDDSLNLRQTLAALRNQEVLASDQKVLIVLDQFEQWLHNNQGTGNTELVQALRQCDGGRVQCLTMVRDDFWMSTTQFMRELEVPLVESQNSTAVDLFPIRHAQKVLAAFGGAFGALPEVDCQITSDQNSFIEQSVSGLAENGKVICVRLALFAEMMKDKPWTPSSLKEVGGTAGVGVSFLEETFSSTTSPPKHRYHQKAVRAVLGAMLGDTSQNIKGHVTSHAELVSASGYDSRPRDFDELIQILDSEIRLITPTDSHGFSHDADSSATDGQQVHYQLTHDYLVDSLREWLTRKQRETRRGRAELRLEERASLWNSKRERRYLPSLLEYSCIQLLTRQRGWTSVQRAMMRSAGQYHAWRLGLAVLVLLLLAMRNAHVRKADRQENQTDRLETSIASLAVAPSDRIPNAISDLETFPRDMVVNRLRKQYRNVESSQRRSIAYALAHFEEVEVDFLLRQIATAPPNECSNIVSALQTVRGEATARIRELSAKADGEQDWAWKGRLAVVAIHLGDAGTAIDINRPSQPDPTQQTVFIHDVLPVWHGGWRQLYSSASGIEDGGLRHGICLAVGQVELKKLDSAQRNWQELCKRWFVESPDSGTHSAAGWALRNWGVELPRIKVDDSAPEKRDWQQTTSGMTLIRIARQDGQRDLWLSDREVSVGQFLQFMPENWENIDESVSPTKRHPAQSVSWEDAIRFCNRLSDHEGLAPFYEVEKLATRDGQSRATIKVALTGSMAGYRLPTEREWEVACRAGTTTDFCFGTDEERLRKYSVFGSNKSEPTGSRMCNRDGLFGGHGNVSEWCYDWYGDAEALSGPLGPDTGSSRVVRGGSWSGAWDGSWSGRGIGGIRGIGRSSDRGKCLPSYAYHHLGFRVARGHIQRSTTDF